LLIHKRGRVERRLKEKGKRVGAMGCDVGEDLKEKKRESKRIGHVCWE